MKRFTSLMLMLLCAVTTWAQNVVTSTAENPVYYVIASYNRGGYLTNAGVGSGVQHVAITDGSYWYFESAGDDGAVYFVNKLKDGENKIYLGGDKTASTTAAKWYIVENGVNTKGLSISSTATVSDGSCIDANNYDEGVGSYKPIANDWAGTTWVFVNDFDATYNPNNLLLRTRSDRYVQTVSLGEETATIDQNYAGDNGRAYFDLTGSVTFKVFAGQEVTPAITRNGGWTNAYAYIDLAGDGFAASVGENGAPAEDLVSYSFYSGDESNDASGYNSNGETLTDNLRNTVTMPSFIAPAEAGTYRMRFKHDWNSIDPNGGNSSFMSNGGSIIDVTLIVKEVTASATINYSYQFNGVEKFTQTSTGYVGDEYPAITVELPFGVTASVPEGVIEAEDVTDGVVNVDIALNVNVPFAYSDSYATVSWQFLKFDSNNEFYLYHNAGLDYIALDSKNFDPDNDNYYWGFIGNPFDGYKIVNKGAGDGYILSSSTTMSGDTGDGTWPIMTAAASLPESNNELWIPTASASAENGFFLAQKGHSSNRMNNRTVDGVFKLAYWTGGAGEGSTFMVEDSETALQALVDAFKTNATKGLGCVGGYPADKADAIDAIATYDDMVAFQSANSVIALDVNKYYRIQNVFRTTFISVTNGERVLKAESNADVNQLWQVELCENGKYLIKSPNAGYMQAVGTNALAAEGAELDINILNNCSGQFEIKTGGYNLAGINNTTLGTWWGAAVDGDMAYRFLEAENVEISLSDISGEGWATTYLPFDVTLDEGLTAYYVSEVGNNVATLAEAADIPANKGVILAGTPGTYTLTLAAATTEITTNYLAGTTVDTEITKVEGSAYYVLANGSEGIGLYTAVLGDDATKFKNTANKAYLVVPASSAEGVASYSFRFPGTTGVEEVKGENGEVKAIYDLTGRRVENIAAPGIYIVNGVKRVVR